MNFNDWLGQHYSPDTVKLYSREIELYLGKKQFSEEAKPQDILNYIGTLRNKYSVTTLHKILSCLKTYYKFLFEMGIVIKNPTRGLRLVDKISSERQLQDLFSESELFSVLQGCNNLTFCGLRNRFLMSLLIYQGLHPKELSSLLFSDLNLEERIISIQASKRVNQRCLRLREIQVTLGDCYLTHIRPIWSSPDSKKRLFITSGGLPITRSDVSKLIIKNLRNRFPGKKANARLVRESVIAKLFKQDHDTSLIQAFAGHQNPATTLRYWEKPLDEMRKSVNRYHMFNGIKEGIRYE